MTPAELAKALDLQCPLIWLDLETTGVIPRLDRIVQIGAIKIHPDGMVEEKSTLINPEIPIPIESTDVHHITDDMVKDAPKFSQVAKSFAEFINMADFGGYSVTFDLNFLKVEFDRARILATLSGRIIDAYRIASKYNPRDLSTMYERYTGLKLTGAHDAVVDTRAALDTFMGQLDAHPDLPRTVEALYTTYFETPTSSLHLDPDGRIIWRGGEACIGFGEKHLGRPLKDVRDQDPGYLKWMIRSEFGPITKKIAQEALSGTFPVQVIK